MERFIVPVAERRKERSLKEEDFGVPNEPPELAEVSDDEDPVNPDDNDAEAQELSAKAEAPGSSHDTRGLGLETFEGRNATGKVGTIKRGPEAPMRISRHMEGVYPRRKKPSYRRVRSYTTRAGCSCQLRCTSAAAHRRRRRSPRTS